MAKQRITLGSILEININNEYFVYAQILSEADYAFFDFKSKERIKDFSILQDCPILFIIAVYDYVVTKGRWLKVGKLEGRRELIVKPMKFIQDTLNPNKFELYNPNTGEITSTTQEEAEGLEYAAVWEAEHVESRIQDYYNGVPNIWVEQLKIK